LSARSPQRRRDARPAARRGRTLLAAGAVAASALAFTLYARVEWPWFVLGWIALVPWLAVLDRCPALTHTLAAGVFMSVAFVLGVFGWFVTAIANYTGAPWPLALLVAVLLTPVLQPQFLTFAVARYLARRRAAGFGLRALVGACVYVGSEWALPKLFGDTIGHGLYASALMRQAADVAGAPGLTFVLIIANECVLEIVSSRTRENEIPPCPPFPKGGIAALCLAALVFALLVYGEVRLEQLRGDDTVARPVTAGIVQADISNYGRLAADMGTFDAVRMILDTHFDLSTQALERARLDLLVWPETVYPTTFGTPKSADGAAFDREIARFVNEARLPLVFGAYDVDAGREYNAAVFLEPASNGHLSFETYRKASLFPLTERVPGWLDLGVTRRWLPWLGTWQPGERPGIMSLTLEDGRTLRVVPLICYDAVDPSLAIAAAREGAELILTLSNDSWFAAGGGPWLHLVVSAFRSLETRRAQVRATNTGISAVIDPTGALVTTAGVHERASLVAQVVPRHGAGTLMLMLGDWFGPVAFATGAALLGWLIVTPRRGRAPAPDSLPATERSETHAQQPGDDGGQSHPG